MQEIDIERESRDIIDDLKEQILSYYSDFIAMLPRLIFGLIAVLIVGYSLRFVRRRLNKLMLLKADDPLLVSFINSVFRIFNVIIVSLLLLYILGFAGIAGSILGAAGISAFVIGFALKDIGENFLAGVIMAFDRPFRLGDTIKTGDVEGVITKMSLRDTHIKTFDGKDVFVPNGQLIKSPLYNYTIDGFIRQKFVIGVDYDSDTDRAIQVIKDAVSSIPGILNYDGRKPSAFISNLNTSTVDITCQFWLDTNDQRYSGLTLKSMAQAATMKALTEEGVAMPSDILEIKNYDDSLKTKNL